MAETGDTDLGDMGYLSWRVFDYNGNEVTKHNLALTKFSSSATFETCLDIKLGYIIVQSTNSDGWQGSITYKGNTA